MPLRARELNYILKVKLLGDKIFLAYTLLLCQWNQSLRPNKERNVMLAKGSRIPPWLIRTYPYQFLIFLTFIIIFGVTFRIAYFHYEDAVDTAIHRNKSIASSSAGIIFESLKGETARIKSYASRPLVIKAARNKDPKEIIRHLASIKNDNPEIDIVFVTDRNGKLWANFPVSKETHGKDFSQYDWYKHASQERELYVSHVYQGIKGEDKPVIVVCSPILDMKGEVIGMLAAYQGIALMRHLADAFIWDPDLKVFLIDREGRIIYANRYHYEKKIIHYPLSRLVKKAREEGKWDLTVEDPSEGGEIKYLAFEPIKGIGWSIIVEKAKKEIFHSVIGRIIEYSVIALLLFVVFVLSLSYLRKVLVCRQLADRKQAQEALFESERRFRDLFDEAPVGYHELDLQGRIIRVNKTELKMLGYTAAEMLGQFMWDFMENKEERQQAFTGKITGTVPPGRRFERTLRRKDGALLPVLVEDRIFRDHEGKITGLRSTIQDISERKRAEEGLRRSEEQMAILNQIANVFLVIPNDEMYGGVLDIVLKELRSPFGVFGFIEDNRDLVIRSMSRQVWDQCQVPEKSIVFSSSTWGDSLWGKAIREKRAFSSAGPFQTPEGHIHIDSFLTVPIVFQNETIGLLSVANKEGGYTEEDQNLLQSIAFNTSPILHARLQREGQERKGKHAEEQLRQLAHRQETLLSEIPDIVMEVDTGKVYTWANPAGYAFFGDDVIGKEAAEYFVDEQDTYTKVQPLFSGDSSLFYVESWQRRKDGENRLLAWWCKTLKDSEGRVTGALSTARDITDLRSTEEALRESEERWQFALEGAGDGVWDWNAQTNKAFYSRQWKSMLGFQEHEIGDMLDEWERRVHPNDRERVYVEINKLFEGKAPVYISEHRVKCKDGTYKWILARGKVMSRTSEGKPLRVIGTHTDITGRKQAEEVMREAEERYRLLFEISTDGVLIRDREGIIRLANPTAVKMLKASRFDEIIGRAYLDFVHPEDRPESIVRIQRMIKAAQRDSGIEAAEMVAPLREHRMLTTDGETIYVESTGLAFRHEGQLWAQGIFHNITKRKQAEEALRKSEEVARRKAKENAIVAEIGRIISSSLNIQDIYERFAEEVGKLIPFNRIAISIINYKNNTFTIPYNSGIEIPRRRTGNVIPLGGTTTEEVVRTRCGLIVREENREELMSRIPGVLFLSQEGFRSLMSIPLISKDQVIGALVLQSIKPDAYTERDLGLAMRVGTQIAGVIANAQLFLERKEVEEVLREAEERYRLLFEISTDGVLIRDREGIIRLANPAAIKLLKASRPDEIIGKAYLDFVHPEDRPGSIDRIQRLIRAVQGEAGTDAADITAPLREHRLLTVNGESVNVESTGTGFRHESQVWIQGSFHDITKRKQAEEALRKSEELARRSAKENAIVAEIGRIISSTLDIENIYERFAEQARELIPSDHIAITTIDREKGTLYIAYVSGYVVPGRGRGEVVSLEGSLSEEAARSRSIQVMQTEDAEEVAGRFPKLLHFWQFGFRSFMAVPLISNDRVVGVLCVYSFRSKAYKEADANLAEQIAAQIAGAIANAQLYAERKRVEEALRKREEEARKLANENAIVAKIGRIISSTFSIEEAYKLFVEEVKNLLSFDRIAISIIDTKKASLVDLYVEGIPVPGRETGEIFPLRGTLSEAVIRVEKGFIIGFENEDEVASKFPGLLSVFAVGLRSFLSVPLISRNQVVGAFHLLSRKYKAYAEEDLRLAECVANQIAGSIANAQLFLECRGAEEQLKVSLKEKEVLLREIHHRVKNNLQVISSLLRLQSRYIRDEEVHKVFKESQDRVRTMAIIHEKLYQSTDLARVDFAGYIRDLTANLYRSYGVSQETIGLRMHVKNVFLGIDMAIPCGLIINELVSNSLKHAFPEGKRGEIFIDLSTDHDQITLIVGDNGGAFQKGVDFRKTGSLGLQLVISLVEQLEGTIELHSDGQTEFRIAFPARHPM